MKRAKRIGVLPSLLTLANLLCGFGSIAYAGSNHYAEAAWLILIGMIFDGLDGRLARVAKLASKFGAELDSLADVVTFGVAPAILVKDVSSAYLNPRLLWPLCALYAACTALRLARFNIETAPDPNAHKQFSGLPSPAAAGVLVSLVILHVHLIAPGVDVFGIAVPQEMFGGIVPRALAFLVATLGALMVSRITYPHLLGQVLSGKRPFAYFAGLLFVGILIATEHEVSLAAAFLIYAFAGPVAYVIHKVRVPREQPAPVERWHP